MNYYKYDGGTIGRGLRYFKALTAIDVPEVLSLRETVIQLCLYPGPQQRGRSNCPGIYIIKKTTMIGNYAFSQNFKPCPKAEYNRALNKLLKIIKSNGYARK